MTQELLSLLKDVHLHGTVTVNKRKLLWLLGWGQDRPDAWKGLLDYWNEISGGKDDLYGLQVNDTIVLTMPTKTGLSSIKSWTKD